MNGCQVSSSFNMYYTDRLRKSVLWETFSLGDYERACHIETLVNVAKKIRKKSVDKLS